MKIKEIVGYLRERNKLSLRNIRTGQEIWHVFVSRINMVFAAVFLLLMVLIAVLATVIYTPVIDLIPGYPGSRSRDALMSNIMKLDSLSDEVNRWEKYHADFARILDGHLPIPEQDDATQRQGIRGSVSSRIELDSMLRREMTSSGSPYLLDSTSRGRDKTKTTFEMLPPIKGMITKSFSPKMGVFGVEIAPAPNQVVMAVLDGTVILNSWNPETGNMIIIQHGGNMVSIYKQVAKAIQSTGERVRTGEPVAITSQLVNGQIPHLTFELWYNGTAVDPENYIVF